MTDGLFLNLFAYRQRENKDPLEDWLTECLAATLRTLPDEQLATLLSELSGSAAEDLRSYVASGKVQIQTQYYAPAVGRPDMLITLDSVPWLLVENKVGHQVSERDRGTERSHQLRDYALWLASYQNEAALPCVIGFVTHLTTAPADFPEARFGTYHGVKSFKSSWGDLARRFLSLTKALDDEHQARALSRAFMKFLEDRDMSNEMPDSTAFAAAEMYVGHAAELENLVDVMWKSACGIANFGKTHDYLLKPVTEQGSVSAWRYVAPGPSSPSRDSVVEVGIWFPELDRWYAREQIGSELRGPHAYVGFLNGRDQYFQHVKGSPEGFLRPSGDFLAVRSIASFPTDPHTRGEELVGWVGAMSAKLRTFLLDNGLVS